MKNTKFYGLMEIANWQLNSNNEDVTLPELQRGFVWKNAQIESLWDSLLRGYPIGSFLLARDADEQLFLLDGQQRATSIALGYYNPWETGNTVQKFWSLKRIPVLWIDLSAKEKPTTQKYSLRLVTQSHPWGYQNTNNNAILSIADRRDALAVFQENPYNSKEKGFTTYSLENVFPYDTYLPVPLSFLIAAVAHQDWKSALLKLCEEKLPEKCKYIKPKHLKGNYLEQLNTKINSDKFASSVIEAVKRLDEAETPCIITRHEVLESEDEQAGEDPTLFVRLNTQGTPLSNDDLIYSMYKAAFPHAKDLVERVGAGFIAPPVVISVFARLALSEINNGDPYPISVNDFRKHIKKSRFVKKLNELIGDEDSSPAKDLFQKAIDILQMKGSIDVPPVLVKYLLKDSRELLLLVLQWLRLYNATELSADKQRKIFAAFTALSWFGRDNTRYVRELWDELKSDDVWSKRTLRKPYYHNNEYIMYPLVQPDILREFLIEQVVNKKVIWDKLYTKNDDELSVQYKGVLEKGEADNTKELIDDIWSNFINKLVDNKSLLLFAQRIYINERFTDFNQLEDLEDTNAPWDWDHIYPQSWVYSKRNVPINVRHWTGTIGNLRAISLEDNRRRSNLESPSEISEEVRATSFIRSNDWQFWQQINDRIYDGDHKGEKKYLAAVIHRLCNIYAEWYDTCKVGELFNFDKKH
jgi:hypothetical protein